MECCNSVISLKCNSGCTKFVLVHNYQFTLFDPHTKFNLTILSDANKLLNEAVIGKTCDNKL